MMRAARSRVVEPGRARRSSRLRRRGKPSYSFQPISRSIMNERVMQFRIGLFVIGAGLVLTMMLFWFGETPSLLRENRYIRVRYDEAPGVGVGIPVRKSGIRIGEVASIDIDDDPKHPDSVIVTIAIEHNFKIREGSTPRISRALIGDVSIDFQPGKGLGFLEMGANPRTAPLIQGSVAADPANALAAATVAFERAGETLNSISGAADGIIDLTKKLQNVGDFLDTWKSTGTRVGSLAENFDQVFKKSGGDFEPMITNLRQISEKLNGVLDPKAQAQLKATIDRLDTVSAKLNQDLSAVEPLLKDLGADSRHIPTTAFGTILFRLNRVVYDVGLLTEALGDGKGRLNPNGTVQNLVTNRELYDNLSRMSSRASELLENLKPVVADMKVFAAKIKNDPSALMRGALQR